MAKKEKPDSAATQSVDAAEKSQNLTPGSHIYMATVPNAAFSLRRHTSRHAPSYIYMIQREVSLTHTHAEHSVTKACRHGNLKAALVHSENKFKIKGLPLVCPTGPMVGSRSVPWRLRRPGALRYGIKPVTDLRPAREPDERQFWHQCKSPPLQAATKEGTSTNGVRETPPQRNQRCQSQRHLPRRKRLAIRVEELARTPVYSVYLHHTQPHNSCGSFRRSARRHRLRGRQCGGSILWSGRVSTKRVSQLQAHSQQCENESLKPFTNTSL